MQTKCRCIGCTTQEYYDSVRNTSINTKIASFKVQKRDFSEENTL